MPDRYVVRVNLEEIAQGDPVEIPHLGVFANGTETEVSEEQIEYYNINSVLPFPDGGYLEVDTEKLREARRAADAGREAVPPEPPPGPVVTDAPGRGRRGGDVTPQGGTGTGEEG